MMQRRSFLATGVAALGGAVLGTMNMAASGESAPSDDLAAREGGGEVDFSTLDVWALAGQSNMQGRAPLEGALESDERVYSFTSAGHWERAQEPLHRLWESFTPVHQDMMRANLPDAQRARSDAEFAAEEAATRLGGAGLGLAFGVTVAEAMRQPVGLIPAAHGGTSLEQWSQTRRKEGGRSLYGALLERIRRAGGHLRGVLWYQGESDALGGAEVAASYAERLDAWIAALRDDLQRPDLPVLVVQLGRLIGPVQEYYPALESPHWDLVREALGALPERVPHTAVTSAVDLGMMDIIHIATPGLIRLGRRLGQLALRLTQAPDRPAGPRVESLEAYHQPNRLPSSWVRVRCSGVTGRWRPSERVMGFSTHTASGEPHPNLVVEALPDPPDPTSLRVLLNAPPEPGLHLGYGVGLDPPCHVTDEADLPLCAFRPRPVQIVAD